MSKQVLPQSAQLALRFVRRKLTATHASVKRSRISECGSRRVRNASGNDLLLQAHTAAQFHFRWSSVKPQIIIPHSEPEIALTCIIQFSESQSVLVPQSIVSETRASDLAALCYRHWHLFLLRTFTGIAQFLGDRFDFKLNDAGLNSNLVATGYYLKKN